LQPEGHVSSDTDLDDFDVDFDDFVGVKFPIYFDNFVVLDFIIVSTEVTSVDGVGFLAAEGGAFKLVTSVGVD
jgi:hypothetical protein